MKGTEWNRKGMKGNEWGISESKQGLAWVNKEPNRANQIKRRDVLKMSDSLSLHTSFHPPAGSFSA
jgi:hypothetical protein